VKLRIALGGVVMVGVLALAWVFGVQPQLAQADQDAQGRAGYEQLTTVYQNQLRSLQADKQNLPALRAQLAADQAYIPTSPSLGEFLAELNQLETRFGVHVTGYQASDAVPAGTTPAASTTATTGTTGSSTAATSATGASATAGLYQIPVQVQVQGSYDKIVDFTGALEKGSRLFIGDKVTIGASQTGAGFAGTIAGNVFVAHVGG